MTRTKIRTLVAVAVVCMGAPLLIWAQRASDKFDPQRVLQPLPPITQFDLKSAEEVDQQLNPDELVIGVEIAGQSRAYPINMLTGPSREIINDELGGTAIAATW